MRYPHVSFPTPATAHTQSSDTTCTPEAARVHRDLSSRTETLRLLTHMPPISRPCSRPPSSLLSLCEFSEEAQGLPGASCQWELPLFVLSELAHFTGNVSFLLCPIGCQNDPLSFLRLTDSPCYDRLPIHSPAYSPIGLSLLPGTVLST